MKTLIMINQFANTPDMPGHTRMFEVAKGLVKLGWKVEVYSSDFNLSTRKFEKIKFFEVCKLESLEGISWNWLRVIPYKKNNWLRILNQLSFCLHFILRVFKRILINKFQKKDHKHTPKTQKKKIKL